MTGFARRLTVGDRLPNFGLPDQAGRRREIYTSINGGPVVVLFLPRKGDGSRKRAVAEMAEAMTVFDQHNAHVFAVVEGKPEEGRAIAESLDVPFPVLADGDGEIVPPYLDAFGLEGHGVMVLDPNQRVTALADDKTEGTLAAAAVKALDSQASVDLPRLISNVAPVLVVPNMLDRDDCRRLIDTWHAGGKEEGRIRDMGAPGGTKTVDYGAKRRTDHVILDPDLETDLAVTLIPRLTPEIDKVFHFPEWTLERFRIGSYSAETSGHFAAHRDNANPHVRRRRFAVTLNLNAEDYAGGDLRFPEYGPDLYRPPTGGAIIFSCGLLHEVVPVTRGVRFVLLTFLLEPPAGG